MTQIPLSTYRVQFHKDFRFADAQALVPYLHKLGITHLYCSPILKARPGSVHGYDVIDHSVINPEIGTEEEFDALSDTLIEHGMSLVIDLVPNHMGIDDSDNRWWQNVLENGPSSPYSRYFDIDWTPPKRDLRHRVLLPFLGDQYGKVLENGEIQLFYEDGAFFVSYYDRRFPIDPRTSRTILDLAHNHVRFVLASDDPELIELESIITALGYLPRRSETEPEKVEERQREKEVAKRRLRKLAEECSPVQRAVVAAVEDLNGQKGDPASFDDLEALLAGQPFRLCYWRVAADEINYRRFFDINELAAIRVEEPEVFEAVHEVPLRLVGEGRVTGLRIDHPDGLFDPHHYFQVLQAKCRAAVTGEPFVIPPIPLKGLDCPCYIAVEKILSHGEHLPETWSVHGTSGYEMLNMINGIFVDPAANDHLQTFYSQICMTRADFRTLVYQCKKLILNVSMSSELNVLARNLDRVSEQHRWSRDFTFWSLHKALTEVIACFPVYRSYIRAESTTVSDEDRRHIESAVRWAKRRNPATDPSIFNFIGSVMLLEEPADLSDTDRAERRDFVMRLQQLTGPVMAKGFEDTAFYRAYPLASLNEVGGEPQRFGFTLDEFHQYNIERQQQWPYAMSASSTHDTKRSEEVRARINVLSEIPEAWTDAAYRWQVFNHDKKAVLEDHDVPDANEEYLLYQTLVGVWPLEPLDDAGHAGFIDRIVGYMEKALKEAKVNTSWVNPNVEYDAAVADFVRAVLARRADNRFLDDLQEFAARLAPAGICNALSQLLIKSMAPGVPDFYQGTETWWFALVDPDNRRPVDYERHAALLDELLASESASPERLLGELVDRWQDDRIKLFLTYKMLHFRRDNPELVLEGKYVVPEVVGQRRDHVCSFLRSTSDQAALVVAPRWVLRMAAGRLPLGEAAWGDTAVQLPQDAPHRWRNLFTGETHEAGRFDLKDLLARFPVALLVST